MGIRARNMDEFAFICNQCDFTDATTTDVPVGPGDTVFPAPFDCMVRFRGIVSAVSSPVGAGLGATAIEGPTGTAITESKATGGASAGDNFNLESNGVLCKKDSLIVFSRTALTSGTATASGSLLLRRVGPREDF